MEEPPIHMFCPVMGSVMLEPHQTDCCGLRLSKEAVAMLQKKERACPQCREPGFTSRRDMAFGREVRQLRVRCPYKRRGCYCVGELSDMDHHVKSCPKKNSPLETDLAQLSQ